VEEMALSFAIGYRRACGLIKLSRNTYYYRSRAKDLSALKMRLRDIALTRVRFGYRRLTILLKREGWEVGKRRVYRLYRELGLEMRSKKRRKLASQQRGNVEKAARANQRWSQLTATKVAHVLDAIALDRGYPESITVDNGTEFSSRIMDGWAYEHGVKLNFIRPGKPVDNGYMGLLKKSPLIKD